MEAGPLINVVNSKNWSKSAWYNTKTICSMNQFKQVLKAIDALLPIGRGQRELIIRRSSNRKNSNSHWILLLIKEILLI
jgi:flagellar biosynthesis/type III secretory pathway ATPase